MTEEDLLVAVQSGNYELVKTALDHNLNPNYNDDEGGYTLLHWAAQEGHTDIIHLLVQSGADVDAYFLGYITPLYNAAGFGNLEVVKALVECGANVNDTQKIGTALHNAAAGGHTDVVEFLIASGADPRAIDDEGKTPLDNAKDILNEAVACYETLANLLS